jgi:hypothetical protein
MPTGPTTWRRGNALTGGVAVAGRQVGSVDDWEEREGVSPNNVLRVGAHRGDGAMVKGGFWPAWRRFLDGGVLWSKVAGEVDTCGTGESKRKMDLILVRGRKMDEELRKGGAHQKAAMVALIPSLPAKDSGGGVDQRQWGGV